MPGQGSVSAQLPSNLSLVICSSAAMLFNPLLCRVSRSFSRKRVEEMRGASLEDGERKKAKRISLLTALDFQP